MPLSSELIASAKKRLSLLPGISESDLRRVTSDLYYALFHLVCESLVEPIGSDPDNPAFKELFLTLYRLPDHQYLENRCKEIKKHAFCEEVKTIARLIVSLKNKREKADYNPLAQFAKSSVENDILQIESAVISFNSSDPVERARFAAFVSIKGARNN